jgi:homoserine O-acetyltransferase
VSAAGRSSPFWRPGDPVGNRRFCEIAAVDLELGGKLEDVCVAYETWGTFTGANAVLVEHALTGDSHVAGEAGPGHLTPGWWRDLIGPGRGIDTDRWFVVASNVLGGCQGTTGPSSLAPDGEAYGSRFPLVTIRDQVSAEVALADALGVRSWALVVGGSMGGMRALEWAVSFPARVRRLLIVASCAAATAEQLALCSAQLHAIRMDPHWRDGDYHRYGARPDAGLALARRIAHLSYRSEEELARRFGRLPQAGEAPLGGDGRYAVESYLDHQAHKLINRFDAGTYVRLTEAMNSHDVGRDRGGAPTALGAVTARTLVLAVDSDRLYLPEQQRELARHVAGAELAIVHSRHGHDGFLLETDQLAELIAPLMID